MTGYVVQGARFDTGMPEGYRRALMEFPGAGGKAQQNTGRGSPSAQEQ